MNVCLLYVYITNQLTHSLLDQEDRDRSIGGKQHRKMLKGEKKKEKGTPRSHSWFKQVVDWYGFFRADADNYKSGRLKTNIWDRFPLNLLC